jgi:HAD superfamily hydrolase (TIGR01509 family)
MSRAAQVRAVLADLDDTLFDHAHATRSALARLRDAEPALTAWSPAELEGRHGEVLEALHLEVLAGARTMDEARVERFTRLLRAAGADDLAARAADAAIFYRRAYQSTWRAVDGAIALLQSLADRGVPVVVVTNNGVAEQRGKLDGCGMTRFVHALVTSEEVGVPKPHVRIFQHALSLVPVEAAEAVMLGDAWTTDIEGARAAGIRPVWLNRLGLAGPDPNVAEIRSLEPTEQTLRVLIGEARPDTTPSGAHRTVPPGVQVGHVGHVGQKDT